MRAKIFGRSRLTEYTELLYIIDEWGSYGKTCGFLHFPFKEEKLSLRDNFSSMGQSTNNIQ